MSAVLSTVSPPRPQRPPEAAALGDYLKGADERAVRRDASRRALALEKRRAEVNRRKSLGNLKIR